MRPGGRKDFRTAFEQRQDLPTARRRDRPPPTPPVPLHRRTISAFLSDNDTREQRLSRTCSGTHRSAAAPIGDTDKVGGRRTPARPAPGSLGPCVRGSRTSPRAFRLARSTTMPAIVDLLDRHHQPLLEQGQQVPIADPTSHRAHQLGVRNRVEEPREIGINHLGMPRVHQLVHMTDRVMGTATGSVRVLLRLQVGLEDRFEHQHRRRLHHAITNARNPQRAQ